jgi:hypothetical protein
MTVIRDFIPIDGFGLNLFLVGQICLFQDDVSNHYLCFRVVFINVNPKFRNVKVLVYLYVKY